MSGQNSGYSSNGSNSAANGSSGHKSRSEDVNRNLGQNSQEITSEESSNASSTTTFIRLGRRTQFEMPIDEDLRTEIQERRDQYETMIEKEDEKTRTRFRPRLDDALWKTMTDLEYLNNRRYMEQRLAAYIQRSSDVPDDLRPSLKSYRISGHDITEELNGFVLALDSLHKSAIELFNRLNEVAKEKNNQRD